VAGQFPLELAALTGILPEIECRNHHFLKCSALNAAPHIVLDLLAAPEDPAIWKSAACPVEGATTLVGRIRNESPP
jgi:hypothetical protein